MEANELRFIIGISLVPIILGAAAYVYLTARSSWASRLLALFLAIIAIRPIGSFAYLTPDDATLVAAFAAYEQDFNYLAWVVFGAFGWIYPSRIRARSLHGAIYLAGWALVTAGFLSFLLARDTTAGSWIYARAGEWLQIFVLGVAVSVTLRARALPDGERRAASALFAALALSPFTYTGSWATGLLTDLVRTGTTDVAMPTTLYAAANFYGWMAAVWAYAIFLAVRERVSMGLALLAVGAAMQIGGLLAPDLASLFAYAYLLRGLVTVHLGQRYALFGMRRPRGAAAFVMPTLALVLVFLMVNTFVISALQDSPFAPPVGVLLGFSLGGLASVLVYPREGWGAVRAPATARRDLLFERYRVLRRLGEGGQGLTQLCHDERLHRDVVVKTVRVDGGEALREARILARVRHPHVVTIFDAEESEGAVHIVMEHVEGGSVRSLLQRGRLPPVEAARVADHVLAGLEACHAAGIVHRDVKPENVLITTDGLAKLADFGVARRGSAQATIVGSVGTFAYMSPEQMRGETVDARADVYAVGVLLSELLSGRTPVAPALDAFEARERLRAGVSAPQDADAGPLADVVARATRRDPAERFASAAAMRDALAAAVARLR